ncbi:S49 family peptidase [Solemya pervernicosa gill symbiont]|uniref:S49 family peptidase n=2 Tax=Gammaproteobacteria incertae sedis TaxID=118884 RepID=A0A1T2LB38_9GAMM|nr:S49 family peptidase [Candidatus Reidiella endopervernicosa]OOZ42222.1 S49 family peptidase [Solemya pervernicosa gill symbiont]QKQ27214.1 S49 family peptidase [Candidatus Reidiella endopervernicosa]
MFNKIEKNVADQNSEGWERDLLNRLAFASINEQRRARRWGIFFKLLLVLYLVGLLFLSVPSLQEGATLKDEKHTALVELEGVIAAGSKASADNIVTGLRDAFEDENTAGVILRINSPGGSPVQSGYINDEIVRLREKYPDTPFYAVISDICASGGYYVAVAADEIYADKASIVGSIGVIMNGFGFVNTLDNLGVERRLYTAGEHKGFLDPFSPENEDEVAHIETLLTDIHGQFIDTVKTGRGERLKENDKLFSGLLWTGAQAVEMGLVDKLGSAGYVAREVIGEADIVDFTPKETLLKRFSDRLGSSMANAITNQVGGLKLQ